MVSQHRALFLIVWFVVTIPLSAAEWSAGVARIDITPRQKLWMGGYANRTRPAGGSLHPLWAKALAITDAGGQELILITLDLLGDNFGRTLADDIRAEVAATSEIEPGRMLFNFSHTHSGPVSRVNDGALVTYGLDAAQQQLVREYTRDLQRKIIQLILSARESRVPVQLVFGQATATFAANRRQQYNPAGPVDHTVPTLAVRSVEGRLVAVLFGYACHTATLTGDNYQLNGDYAGFAQIALERRYPQAVALFMMGCGADANPAPRGSVLLARQHGETLASAVESVLERHPDDTPLRGPLRVEFGRVELPFVEPPTPAELEARRQQGDVYEQRLTQVLLQRLARQGSLSSHYPFPVHVIRFGEDLTLVALGGETVVDFALRLHRELPTHQLWVAGYCNEVFAYIPSERVLAEGGYEAGGAMRYFGIHGPFQPGLEDKIIGLVKQLMGR